MTDVEAARLAERKRYSEIYGSMPDYRMGSRRLQETISFLREVPRGSLLDVSCGRQEILSYAEGVGFGPVLGTEYTPELCDGRSVIEAPAHALPFADLTFDVVTMFDVVEHLVPGDDELACRELNRVATKTILVSANNKPSVLPLHGDLHINKRPYKQWDALFRSWFCGEVSWISRGSSTLSEYWRIKLS